MLKGVLLVAAAAQLVVVNSVFTHHRNDQVISIDVSNNSPDGANNVFRYRDILTEGSARILVSGLSDSVGFFVAQVHTYLYPVLFSTAPNDASNSINGTNVGLVQINKGAGRYEFSVTSDPSIKISVLISVVLYNRSAPVPGGCNLTFKTEIAPYQLVKLLNDDIIRVDAQAPSIQGGPCELARPSLEFYHLYLKEPNYLEENYFDGLEKMMTVNAIRAYGNKIPGNPVAQLRNYYSAYRGTGAVFAIVASWENETSAYVPAISYACNALKWDDDCNGPITVHWKFICASMLFIGFFICFYGHRFFRVSLFFSGFLTGAFLTYIALVAGYALPFEDSTLTACGFGVIYGAFWVFLWWRFGVPLFSVHLAFLIAGLLLGCIVFYSRVQDLELFRSDVNYWLVLTCMTLSYTLILSGLSALGNIISCSLLGSYAVVAALSHYVGGHMQYIVINMFRRATVENFKLAMVDPPFPPKDINLTVAWVVFFLVGIYAQIWLQKGKPPFPPNRALLIERNRENTPLLIDSSPGVVYTE